MKKAQVERQHINLEALDDTLRTDLGIVYVGLSQRKGIVIAHLTDSATSADIARAQQLITDHDDTTMSTRQQAQQAQRQRLVNARQTYSGDIDLTAFSLTDPLVRQLAEQVFLLRLEVQALRNADT